MTPFLRRLDLNGFRNYQSVSFSPGSAVAVISGDNGAGKTSLVEAIHVLATGRSFRTGRLEKLVENSVSQAVLFSEVGDLDDPGSLVHKVGMGRSRQGITELKLDGQRVRGLSEVARLLPVLVMHPGTLDLVEGGSSGRRRLLDWLLFHVEHDFQSRWQAFANALKQRNNLLKKNRFSSAEIQVWNRQLVQTSARIDQFRQSVFPAFQARFSSVLAALSPDLEPVTLTLSRGWEKDRELDELLVERQALDLSRGFTSVGAHRADIRLSSPAGSVKEVFSRGQKKIVAYALVLAQQAVLRELAGITAIVLVDDLSSELDEQHCEGVLGSLLQTGGQVIVTSLARQLPPGIQQENSQVSMFHVEHGRLARWDESRD